MEEEDFQADDPSGSTAPRKKKPKKRHASRDKSEDTRSKKPRKQARKTVPSAAETALAAQQAVNEQMRRALQEDQYSAHGSIVDTDSDEEEQYMYRGQPVRLDRAALQQAVRKFALMERFTGGVGGNDEDEAAARGTAAELEEPRKQKSSKTKRGKEDARSGGATTGTEDAAAVPSKEATAVADPLELEAEDLDRDGGSIFGQTSGSSNATWVECDKCKKWRRLRGVVDEKKLPSKWYCSMNKNDPERARCSAPEEAYESTHSIESAADTRTRKHLRVWVRRLQCNEAYEARQPTLTRGKKRAASSSSKEPYEWVRCCNPSCGKWRAILRIMDAKTNVIDRTTDGEWYCVMNTWDEKSASCAAPQENLPAVGCPSWVMQDE